MSIERDLGVLLVSYLLTFSDAGLPAYIKQCDLSDPNINSCIVQNANEAIPTIVKGDAAYKIPLMSPIVLPEVSLEPGSNLKIQLFNVTTDLTDIKVTDAKFDKDTNHLSLTLKLDTLSVQCVYGIKGKILVLPITGEGPANVTYVGGTYQSDVDLKIVNKNGKNYYRIADSKFDFTIKRGYFRFENLFGGDKALGDQMNSFIDENWSQFAEELKPALCLVMKSVVETALAGYFGKVPKEELFKNA